MGLRAAGTRTGPRTAFGGQRGCCRTGPLQNIHEDYSLGPKSYDVRAIVVSSSIYRLTYLNRNGRLSSMLSIEIMKGDHDSSESLVLARAATCFRDLLERCADGDGESSLYSYIFKC